MPGYVNISKEAFAALGAPELVYIRAVAVREVFGDQSLPDDLALEPDSIVYAVHAADGSRLAVMGDRQSAFAAARGHELKPVSVH